MERLYKIHKDSGIENEPDEVFEKAFGEYDKYLNKSSSDYVNLKTMCRQLWEESKLAERARWEGSNHNQ